MKVTLKLFATLAEYLPPESKYTNIVELEVATGTTVGMIIEQKELPPKWVHLVLVNGRYIDPDKRAEQPLVEGDVLAIWPPIAGG
jgi:molybdopterin synthase sulfur carrier subunit